MIEKKPFHIYECTNGDHTWEPYKNSFQHAKCNVCGVIGFRMKPGVYKNYCCQFCNGSPQKHAVGWSAGRRCCKDCFRKMRIVPDPEPPGAESMSIIDSGLGHHRHGKRGPGEW